jgi:glycosyltransferase involved in cell wall biosynthesis
MLGKPDSKVVSRGKFLSRLDRKFFFKAMRLNDRGDSFDFNQKLALRRRFDDLGKAHTTGLILKESQAEPLLGIAAQSGLQVLVEVAVPVDELLSDSGLRSLTSRLFHTAHVLRAYPALMGYLIDCGVDPAALRHRGVDRVRKRLGKLIRTIRRADPDRLIAMKHRPATVGLTLLDEDLIYAELPPLSPAELRSYVIRLHNLAEARPVVLELGEGLPGQDELVACAFGLGAAGVVAPAMRPAASHGWLGIRMLSAGELLPFVTLNGACPPKIADAPMVSVVICAFNAERTMRACLESLRTIDYPNYEVIIVDDGSFDHTAEISADFPEFRLIRQPNRGLSVARNVGMQAAHGDLIAYTDSDCVVDPHWLTLMVRTMTASGFDGCGGPNYAPHESGWVEGAVAASPGAPCHVLVGDDRAEHLAGCNMVFRKAALLAIGGFDPQFTAAGDDVDICWRLIDGGYAIGFCPAAFVWHFRRNTVKAYYGQQRGYGKAEAMLFLKYPDRFNGLGQIRWRGTIPGLARTIPGGGQNRIGWTRRRRNLRQELSEEMQRVHEAPLSILRVFPLTAEWNAAAAVALVLSLGMGITLIPALIMLSLSPLWAIYYAAKAPLEKCHHGFIARMLIAMLAYTGPMARTIARYRWRKKARRPGILDVPPRQRATIDWPKRTVRLAYWNEAWTTRDSLLDRVSRLHAQVGRPTTPETGWSDADLMLERGALTRVTIKTADEEHSGNRMKNHVAIRARLTGLTWVGLAVSATAAAIATALGAETLGLTLAAVTAGVTICAASEVVETLRLAYRIVEQSASELGLVPLGAPTAAALLKSEKVAIKSQEGVTQRVAI